jgi:serralysin
MNMPSFIITGADTTAETLEFGEVGIVTSGGALSASFVTAVTVTGYSLLTVQGAISAFNTGVGSTDGGQIVIGSGGVITAGGVALSFTGGIGSNIATVDNAGTVTGNTGISLIARVFRMTNSGDISGYGGAGIELDCQNGLVLIRNSGIVAGNNFGVISTGNSDERISNTGTITGRTGAMTLSDAASTVTNTGLMDGAVDLAGGADKFDGTAGVQGSVFGGTGADTVWGGGGEDGLFGDAGADILRGYAGDDVLDGGADGDRLFGGLDDDVIYGGATGDNLRGGQGDDFIYGGSGADFLTGGLGDDRMTGGTEVDTFVFTRGQGTDRITDFVNNVDKLDLRAFDFASVAAVAALASASSFGLRIDVPGEGVVFVAGLTLATLNGADLLL